MKQAFICLFALGTLVSAQEASDVHEMERCYTLCAKHHIPESKCTVKVYQVLLDDDTKAAKAEAEEARRKLKAEDDEAQRRMKAAEERRRRDDAAKTREELAEWRDEVAQSREATEKHPYSPTLKQIYEGNLRRLQEAEQRCQKLGCEVKKQATARQ